MFRSAPSRSTRGHALVVALALTLGLSGCWWAYDAPSWTIQAEASPPYPYAEIVPPEPGPGYMWIDGYWHWDGVRYIWLRGHWSRPPVVGYVWAPSGWVMIDGRYQFYAGRWVHPSYRTSVNYYRTRVPPRTGTTYQTVPRREGRPVSPAPVATPAQKARPE